MEQARITLLKEWPALENNAPDRVVAAMTPYLSAFLAEKEAIEEHDAYDAHVWLTPTTHAALEAHWDHVGRLRRACTETRRQRKRTWRALMDAMEQDYGNTSSDDEDGF